MSYFIFCQTQFETFQHSPATYTSQYICWLTDLSEYSEGKPIKSQSFFGLYRTQVQSLPCFVSPSVLLLNFVQIGFVKVVTWISRSCYMDLSKLIPGFLLVFAWVCQSCYMDSSKLLLELVKIVLFFLSKLVEASALN